jgi:HEXXH motif-containing protein
MTPDAAAVARLKAEVKVRLHRSLEHLVFEAAAGQVPPALSPEDLARMTAAEGYPSAIVFAAHAALLQAAEADRADLFARDSAALAALPRSEHHATGGPAVVPLSEPAVSAAGQAFLTRAFRDDIGLTTDLTGPSAEETARAADLIETALSAFRAVLPDHHAQFRELVSLVVLAKPGPGAERGFGGATVFDAFGALLLNAANLRTPEGTLMSLVHEAAHQQLFLCHLDDPVLLNDAQARHVSPLRAEPRPMEGVFHAAWVSAHMALVADGMLGAAGAPGWAAGLASHRERAVTAVRDAIPTIEQGAEFTPLGAALFEDLRQSMGRL